MSTSNAGSRGWARSNDRQLGYCERIVGLAAMRTLQRVKPDTEVKKCIEGKRCFAMIEAGIANPESQQGIGFCLKCPYPDGCVVYESLH